ncbi:MAG TPA: hypothetical protein H9972_00180, partial [Candidatus Paraprevotella stercorigallinarum]|nr:hypothetical protein [Candidatus Paraprevotella stercorigallinarum]
SALFTITAAFACALFNRDLISFTHRMYSPFYFLNDSIVFTMPSRASTGSRPTPIARFIFSFDDT